MNVRCFIAMDLNDQVRNELRGLIEELKRQHGDVKWVRPENIHLTLKFLGNTPQDILRPISESLAVLSSSYRPFSVRVSGTGVFPGKRNPRILWVGLLDSEFLVHMQRDIEQAMASFGYQEEERSFRPHLTIGRVRSPKGMLSTMKTLGVHERREFGTVLVEGIRLLKSDLRPTGPEYACLYDLWFGKGQEGPCDGNSGITSPNNPQIIRRNNDE